MRGSAAGLRPGEVSWGQKVQTLPLGGSPTALRGLTAAERGAPAGRVQTGDTKGRRCCRRGSLRAAGVSTVNCPQAELVATAEGSCFGDSQPEALGEPAGRQPCRAPGVRVPAAASCGRPAQRWSLAAFLCAPRTGVPGGRSPPPDAGALAGDSMTLSLISLLSQDISGLWLLLKTSTGASSLRFGAGCEWRVCRERGAGGPSGDGFAHHPIGQLQRGARLCLPSLLRGIQAGVERGVLLQGVGTSGIASWFGAVATWPPSLPGFLCPWSKGAQSPHSPWELERTLVGSFVPAFLQMCLWAQEGSPEPVVQGLVAGSDSGTELSRAPVHSALRSRALQVAGVRTGPVRPVDSEGPVLGWSTWASFAIPAPNSAGG